MDRRVKIWLAASLLAGFVGLLLVVGLLSGRAKGAYRIVMERWSQTVGTPDEVFARFPPRVTNDPARELVDTTVRIGIDIAPRFEEDFPRPDRSQTKRFKRFMGAGGGWLNTQLRKASGPPDPPPEAVLGFLLEFREPLDRVQAILGEENVPEWPSDMTLLYNPPIPNLLGHLDLTKILIMDCLAAVHAGDEERAGRALEAAWALDRVLGDDPILIVQMIRLNMARLHAAAVRYTPRLEHWIARLDGRRDRARIEEALLLEGWTWPQYDFTSGNEQDVLARIGHAVTGPYMKLGTIDASERWRRTILSLNEARAWCDPELRRSGIRLNIPVPWWNRIGAMLVPSIESTVKRVAHVQLQLEMSRKLLEIDAVRRKTGRWPVLEEDALESEVCPGDRWLYEARGDVATLRLNRQPEVENERRFPATWSFSIQMPGDGP